jgi:hypothetical protein
MVDFETYLNYYNVSENNSVSETIAINGKTWTREDIENTLSCTGIPTVEHILNIAQGGK